MTMERPPAHGVTPSMAHRYATRTAVKQAAFLLPYLRPGMSLLDCGCGPGSITLGLAEAVAPGQVVGIDHDPGHVDAARAAAEARGISNASFQEGDVYGLPFADGSFDVAYENSMVIHLAEPVTAVSEIWRVLKAGGLLALRDTDMDGHIVGNSGAYHARSYELFGMWHRHRGSNLNVGKSLRAILREAGFESVTVSASTEVLESPDEVAEHGDTFVGLLTGNLGEVAVDQGWAARDELDQLADAWRVWRKHPDSFLVNVMCEAIGWKPETNES